MEDGDVVMVVESDKADMDVETYSSGEHDLNDLTRMNGGLTMPTDTTLGYLAKILTPEGESAGVGETVALIAEVRVCVSHLMFSCLPCCCC